MARLASDHFRCDQTGFTGLSSWVQAGSPEAVTSPGPPISSAHHTRERGVKVGPHDHESAGELLVCGIYQPGIVPPRVKALAGPPRVKALAAVGNHMAEVQPQRPVWPSRTSMCTQVVSSQGRRQSQVAAAGASICARASHSAGVRLATVRYLSKPSRR